MDSLTHIALGAVVGEAFFERGFGKKAMWWGALAQSIPDIDFVAGLWLPLTDNLLAHRGFTHSLLFAALIVPLMAFVVDRIHRPHDFLFRKWILFFSAEVLLHLFLDGFNNYGVGWFEPFSHVRFSFNTLYVADPFFSIWTAIALVMLMIYRRYDSRRRFWWKFGLIMPLLYLGYCTFNKLKIDREVRQALSDQNIPHKRYFTTPAPLQNLLWFVVAGDDKGYSVGYRSVFDKDKRIDFEYFPRNDSFLANSKAEQDVQNLIKFSEQFYVVEKWNDTLVFNDLRFGQIVGWDYPRNKFVFHYFLTYPDANDAVVQRGRFTGWNSRTFRSMLTRIKGK